MSNILLINEAIFPLFNPSIIFGIESMKFASPSLVTSTPFGKPVVPDVNRIYAIVLQ